MRFGRSSGLCRFSDSTLCSCARDAGSSFDALEADEFTFLLVPETESEAFKSFNEGEGLHILENLVGVVAGLEIVVRDTRAEVMDVVEADISGEPLEDFGKLGPHARAFACSENNNIRFCHSLFTFTTAG